MGSVPIKGEFSYLYKGTLCTFKYDLETLEHDEYQKILDHVIDGDIQPILECKNIPALMIMQGSLALNLAATHGHLHIVKFCIENGANPFACSYTAMDRAKEGYHTEIVQYLSDFQKVELNFPKSEFKHIK